jgi:hypothetical protein
MNLSILMKDFDKNDPTTLEMLIKKVLFSNLIGIMQEFRGEISDLQPCQRHSHQYQRVVMLTVVIKFDHHFREQGSGN